MEQAEPFDARFHLGEEVIEVSPLEQGGFRVATNCDKAFDAKTVFIAGGVGSFQPRKVRQPEAESLEDKQLFYRVRDPSQFHGKKIVILGGGDSALDWAMDLAPKAESLTLVHRRDEFRGMEASVETLESLVASGQAEIVRSSALAGLNVEEGLLVSVDIKGPDDEIRTIPTDALLVFFGLSPKLGPIAEWGLEISRKTIAVDTEKFETTIPGIFAIGDINNYPGKKKLILSGFHEAALAAFAAKSVIEPDKKIHLQYTTTSPIMHKRLGVEDE
jgi:thioredoxin reductase (NADPH)